MPEAHNEQNQIAFSLLCLTALFVSAVLFAKVGNFTYHFLDNNNDTKSTNHSEAVTNITLTENKSRTDDIKDVLKHISKPKMVIKPQPTCPPQNKYLQFSALCEELIFTKFCCKPEDVMNPDKHKIPKYYYQSSVKNNSNNETQNTIVNFIIAALLITSLGAALLEFYRAKISPSPENGKKGAKAPLSRKCSLADLTVLKHHRKELVRRESILEQHFEEEGDTLQHQGFQRPSLYRRCSFPATLPSNDTSPGGTGYHTRRNSRQLSMATDINRRMSIVNEGSRKLSIVTDDDVWRRGSIVGEDSSPERRVHHSRLVHRH